jgi:hypothetical protein
LFSTDDWYVEEGPVTGWGYNAKGTFYLRIERDFGNGPKPWTMNIPKSKLGNLPSLLDQLPNEQRELLRFTGGWQAGDAQCIVGLATD